MSRRKSRSAAISIAASLPQRQTSRERAGPTPEQQRHAPYEEQDIVDKQANGISIKIGKAYRRQPIFETLWKQRGSGITAEGLRALRYYRARHEETEQSLTRCALDVQGRGGGGSAPHPRGIDISTPLEFVVHADRVIDRLERAVGPVADTMRAVALDDRSYSDVAIQRWGSRKQNWIAQPEGTGGKASHVEKIVPKSGRHREAIRQEFLLGLRRLVQAVQLLTARPADLRPKGRGVANVVPGTQAALNEPDSRAGISVDPVFLNDQGYLRDWDDIAAIIRSRAA